jgi:hypothetical protein
VGKVTRIVVSDGNMDSHVGTVTRIVMSEG